VNAAGTVRSSSPTSMDECIAEKEENQVWSHSVAGGNDELEIDALSEDTEDDDFDGSQVTAVITRRFADFQSSAVVPKRIRAGNHLVSNQVIASKDQFADDFLVSNDEFLSVKPRHEESLRTVFGGGLTFDVAQGLGTPNNRGGSVVLLNSGAELGGRSGSVSRGGPKSLKSLGNSFRSQKNAHGEEIDAMIEDLVGKSFTWDKSKRKTDGHVDVNRTTEENRSTGITRDAGALRNMLLNNHALARHSDAGSQKAQAPIVRISEGTQNTVSFKLQRMESSEDASFEQPSPSRVSLVMVRPEEIERCIHSKEKTPAGGAKRLEMDDSLAFEEADFSEDEAAREDVKSLPAKMLAKLDARSKENAQPKTRSHESGQGVGKSGGDGPLSMKWLRGITPKSACESPLHSPLLSPKSRLVKQDSNQKRSKSSARDGLSSPLAKSQTSNESLVKEKGQWFSRLGFKSKQ